MTTFTSTWRIPANTPTTITLPLIGQTSCTVNWGDGTPDEDVPVINAPSHTYNTTIATTYTVTVNNLPRTPTTFISFYNETGQLPSNEYLVAITSFGPVKIGGNGSQFAGCSNLTSLPNGIVFPANCFSMFNGCMYFNSDLSNCNTANVINMERMFDGCVLFNSSLSNWDTSNVINMNSMFAGCTNFNGNISNWNTSKVTNMTGMFAVCNKFNGNISDWDTSNVTSMQDIFLDCTDFIIDISKWNMSSITGTYLSPVFSDKYINTVKPSFNSASNPTSWKFTQSANLDVDILEHLIPNATLRTKYRITTVQENTKTMFVLSLISIPSSTSSISQSISKIATANSAISQFY